MNPKHERISGLCEIARHLLDPLPGLKSAQRVNAVLRRLILCLGVVEREGQRQENDDRDRSGEQDGAPRRLNAIRGISVQINSVA
jgi:hypothetical protein